MMRYEAELNGVARRVDDLEQLHRLLEEVRQADQTRLYIRQINGEMAGFERFLYKMLGITTVIEGKNAMLLTRGAVSTLIFGDEAGHELRVLQKNGDGASGGDVTFDLGDGSVAIHCAKECLSRDEAMRAIEGFYVTGKPPSWLTYHQTR